MQERMLDREIAKNKQIFEIKQKLHTSYDPHAKELDLAKH